MKKIVFVIILFLSSFSYSQEMKNYPINYYEEIGEYDISKLFISDSIIIEHEGGVKQNKPQPLGFIGEEYQRFYIHFLSIAKQIKYKHKYFVRGKTRVKDNICDFEGEINIEECKTGNMIWILDSIDKFDTGYMKGSYQFMENKECHHSGILEGEFLIKFYFDKKGRMQYDGLRIYADDFSNNQFWGYWTSYDKKINLECTWGDFRIPNSKGFDIGVGEFSPNPKYIKNGWENYNENESEWWIDNRR